MMLVVGLPKLQSLRFPKDIFEMFLFFFIFEAVEGFVMKLCHLKNPAKNISVYLM